jgi:hypothetical protein
LEGAAWIFQRISNLGFVHWPLSSTAFVAISQSACRAIILSTFADSRLSRFPASADVFDAG